MHHEIKPTGLGYVLTRNAHYPIAIRIGNQRLRRHGALSETLDNKTHRLDDPEAGIKTKTFLQIPPRKNGARFTGLTMSVDRVVVIAKCDLVHVIYLLFSIS